MTIRYEQAVDLIQKHAGLPQPGIGYTGLLARLRPFAGLDDGDFLELLEALTVLAPRLRAGPPPDRVVVASLWDICRTARFWARPPGGPGAGLDRGSFIPAPARRRLDVWVDEVERIVLELMHGEESWWAFQSTAWLSVRERFGPRAGFLVPVWSDALSALLADERDGPGDGGPQAYDMRVLCEAIGQTGSGAVPAAGLLSRVVAGTRSLPVKRSAARALKAAMPATE